MRIAAHPLDQALEELRLDRARARTPGSRSSTPGRRNRNWRAARRRHRVVELGIVEHDQRRLAAELERDVLERLRRVAHHRLAGAHLAGQRHLADAGMAGQQAGRSRQSPARLGTRPPAAPPRAKISSSFTALKRRELRRLENHGIAAGERGRGLPAGDLQRIVPGADAGHHAQGLAARVAEGLGTQIDVLAAQGLREAREVFEAFRAGDHIHHQGLLNRLAGVARFELGELLIARAQQFAPPAQHARPLRAGHRRPFGLAALRRAHRRVDFAGARHGHLAQHLPVGRD